MPTHNEPPKIPSPANTPSNPDKATQKGLDMTGPFADNRVLHINFGCFKYGTDDKAHAAAVILSLTLLFIIILVSLAGMWASNVEWAKTVFNWLGNAFLIITGIALGGKMSSRNNYED